MSDDSTSKPDPSEATAPDTGAADAAAREAKRLKKEKKRQQRAIGLGDGVADRAALTGVAFHASRLPESGGL